MYTLYTYQFELAEHVSVGGLQTTFVQDFFSEPLLPFRVDAEQEHSPGEQMRGGLMASKVEGLALVYDLING